MSFWEPAHDPKSYCCSVALTLVAASPAFAGNCGNTAAGFDEWLASFKKHAVTAGIPAKAASSGLDDIGKDTWVRSTP